MDKIDVIEIVEWLKDGEFDSGIAHDTGDVMWQASELLDEACTWEISGNPLFLGSDGIYYTVVTDMRIVPENPLLVLDDLEELKNAALESGDKNKAAHYQELLDNLTSSTSQKG